jgi:uncharacterized protein (TIGR02217 family)
MAEFLEERIPPCVKIDAVYEEEYVVDIVESGGSDSVNSIEYRRLVHPFPRRKFNVAYHIDRDELYEKVISLYHRVHGKFAGFRHKHLDDYTTAQDGHSPPTATDQTLQHLQTNTYQMVKQYGDNKSPSAAGWPKRLIFKPVEGSVKIGINGSSETLDPTRFSVDHEQGKVVVNGYNSGINNISNALLAEVDVGIGHLWVVGEQVRLSGVVGMTQVNNNAYDVVAISATTITLNVDSTGFGAYVSGGSVDSAFVNGNPVTFGCEFDYPVRFNSTLSVSAGHLTHRLVQFELIELINL